MRLFITIIIFYLSAQFSLAQTDSLSRKNKIDSLYQKLQKDSARIFRFQKIRPYLCFDNRKTVIRDAGSTKKESAASLNGIQLGVILNEDNFFGLGFYSLTQNSKKPYATNEGTVSATKSIAMNYMTFFYIHSFIDRRHFELNMPLEIGIGGYNISYTYSTGPLLNKEVTGGIIPIGIGFQTNFYPFSDKWVGISLLIGFRKVLEKDVDQNFSGGYSSFGLCFDLRQIYRDIKYPITRKRCRREVKKIAANSL